MKIICMGDSVTYGQSVRADQAWPAALARMTGHDVRNEGVCGETSRMALDRWPKVVDLHVPDVVVIQYGLNDANCWETDHGLPRVTQAAYVANVGEMVSRTLVAGGKPIVLRPHKPAEDSAFAERVMTYAVALSHMMPSLSVCAVDESFASDGYGLHPDVAMHERYAQAVYKLLP